jgi:hypothetical protein
VVPFTPPKQTAPGAPVLVVEDGVVLVVVGDEVTKVDGVELGVGIAVSH